MARPLVPRSPWDLHRQPPEAHLAVSLAFGALMWLQVLLPLRVTLLRRTRILAMFVMTAVLIFFPAIQICAGGLLTRSASASPRCPLALGSAPLLHACCVSRSS